MSPVFYAMFYGANKSEPNEIEVPDVKEEAFLTVVKYLYYDAQDLNDENVLSTLYASRKYMLPFLTQACVAYVVRNLKANNVFQILRQSTGYNEDGLTEKCLQLIDREAVTLLKSSDFLKVDLDILKRILQRDTLRCPETSVFNAASNWATAECMRQGMKEDQITAAIMLQCVNTAR